MALLVDPPTEDVDDDEGDDNERNSDPQDDNYHGSEGDIVLYRLSHSAQECPRTYHQP